MKIFSKNIAVIIALMGFALSCHATNVQKKVYMMGMALSLNDSIVAVTEVQTVDSAWIDNRTKFLYGRENYSYQLKEHLKNAGMEAPTCITIFATSEKDIQKKAQKLMRKYVSNGNYLMQTISKETFQYEVVEYEEEEVLTKEELKQIKEENKKRMQAKKQRMAEKKAEAKASKKALAEAEKAEKAKAKVAKAANK